MFILQDTDVNASTTNGDVTHESEVKDVEVKKICSRCFSKEMEDNIDEQWRQAVKRIDLVAFFLFMLIFGLLLIIMLYPHNTTISVNTKDCAL